MGMKSIVTGHLKELIGSEQELSGSRMEICSKCPIIALKSYGYVCDSSKHLNPETNEVSYLYKDGFYKGCGCRLNAKTREQEEHCPAGKWENGFENN